MPNALYHYLTTAGRDDLAARVTRHALLRSASTEAIDLAVEQLLRECTPVADLLIEWRQRHNHSPKHQEDV